MKQLTFFSIMIMLLVSGVITSPAKADISINVGGSAVGSFVADQYYSGGSTYSNTATIDMSQITGDVPVDVFHSERYDACTYTIPGLTVGSAQTVTLYFAETYLSAAGARLFNVSINGTMVLSNFDIYAEAGGQNKAIARTFNTTASNSGQVVIQFITGPIQSPKVCGITVAANEGGPTLALSPISLNLAAAEGSTGTFDVNSNAGWTVSSNQAWLTASPASGSGDGTVTVTAQENTDATTRTAAVTVLLANGASQSVTVTQIPVLALSTTWLLVAAAENSTGTFNISTEIGWTVSSDQTWLAVSPESGSNDGMVTVTAAENTDPSTRTAMVTVTAGGSSQAVTVIQSAGGGACVVPPMPPFSALVDNNKLPDPFTFMDGRPVTTIEEWECRRAEIAALVQEFELGYMQQTPYSATTGAMSGSNLVVTVTDNGVTKSFNCSITYPSTGIPPYPAMIGCGGSSLNATALSNLGVAVISFPNGTVAQQNNASSRGKGVFYDIYGSNHSAGALMAWAWGVNRLIDAIEKTPAANIDPSRLAATGCSRNGKGALVIGAFCDRIKLTIPQESGAGGCASWRVSQYQRDVLGGNVQWLAQIVGENCWLRADFGRFGNAVNKLPFDQHEIAALCAPRALLFIENGSQDWLGNQSTWTVGNAAHMVWEAMGIPQKMGYSSDGTHSHCAFPAAQQPTVNAYVQKYLVGGGTADTNVMYTDNIGLPYIPADWVNWIDWTAPSIPENDQPTPDPMTWALPPTATGATSIAMIATSATDATEVQYFFECTSDGNKSSGWQPAPTYVLTGLARNTEYSFRVKVRDSDAVPNETDWSSTVSATTPEASVDIIGLWLTGTTHVAEPGTGRGLVFLTHAEKIAIAPFGPTSVTYGGQSMTKIVDVNFGTTGSVVSAAAFWLSEAGIAAATDSNFVVTWSAGPNSTAYDSVFFEGVNQTTPIGARDSNGTPTGATITTFPLSTNVGDLVIDSATCSGTGSYTVNNGFIEAQELTITSADAVNGYKGFKQAAGGNETPSVTHSTSTNRQVLLGFVVQANHVPTADAGLDQAVYVHDLVTLDGSTSFDTDGDSITYKWAFTALPQGSAAALDDATSVNPTFTVDKNGTYVLSLIVNDGTVDSLVDTVVVSTINVAPVADSGDDQSAVVSYTTTLDGSGSFDQDGDPLTYSWAFTSKPCRSKAVLMSPASVSPSFTADLPGIYVLTLIVNDGYIDSAPDSVTVSVVSQKTWAIEMAEQIIQTINAMDGSAFKNHHNKKALTNKLNTVIDKIERRDYRDAVRELENDVLGKTDGCAETGDVDHNDWIIDCSAQALVYQPILDLINVLETIPRACGPGCIHGWHRHGCRAGEH